MKKIYFSPETLISEVKTEFHLCQASVGDINGDTGIVSGGDDETGIGGDARSGGWFGDDDY